MQIGSADNWFKKGSIRVLLVDELALIRGALRALLASFQDMVVVREASSEDEILLAVSESSPDLIVTELQLSGRECISTITELRRVAPALRILILTTCTDPALVRRALEIGVEGCMMRGCSVHEFEYAIRCVMSGKAYYSADVTHLLLATRGGPGAQLPLTARQMEVLKLLGRGHATKEIAFQLGLSEKTVAAHRARIMERLQLSSLAELVHYCIKEGLIPIAAPKNPCVAY